MVLKVPLRDTNSDFPAIQRKDAIAKESTLKGIFELGVLGNIFLQLGYGNDPVGKERTH